MKRTQIEISKELRIKTLIPVLQGLPLEKIAKEQAISIKGLKYRLGLIYKYYGVKNRIELMALYVTVPTPFYRFIRGTKRPKGIKVSKVTYGDAQERFNDNDSQLPFNKLLNSNNT